MILCTVRRRRVQLGFPDNDVGFWGSGFRFEGLQAAKGLKMLCACVFVFKHGVVRVLY